MTPTSNRIHAYCGRLGAYARIDRVLSSEVACTIMAACPGGDNRPSIVITNLCDGMDKPMIDKCESKRANYKRFFSKSATAILDRCGNNWKNGKGGCGIMMNQESTPCLATMFQPFVLLSTTHEKDNSHVANQAHTT